VALSLAPMIGLSRPTNPHPVLWNCQLQVAMNNKKLYKREKQQTVKEGNFDQKSNSLILAAGIQNRNDPNCGISASPHDKSANSDEGLLELQKHVVPLKSEENIAGLFGFRVHL